MWTTIIGIIWEAIKVFFSRKEAVVPKEILKEERNEALHLVNDEPVSKSKSINSLRRD